MIRKKINTIEEKINKVLLHNISSIGFDVSMYSTGIALLETTSKYIQIKELEIIRVPKLPKNANSKQELHTINVFIEQLDNIKEKFIQKYNLDIGLIEDTFFKQSVKTLKDLTRYGILVYDRFKNVVEDIDLITPTSARSKISFKKSDKKIKGGALKKELVQYINNLFNLDLKAKDHDKSDALVLALAGMIDREKGKLY